MSSLSAAPEYLLIDQRSSHWISCVNLL